MTHPTFDDHFDRFKGFLEAGPDKGWIFGVCASIARRTGWDLWAVRLVAAIALLSFTITTMVSYFALAMLMDETRPAAQRRISDWARNADTLTERVWSGLKQLIASRENHREPSGHSGGPIR